MVNDAFIAPLLMAVDRFSRFPFLPWKTPVERQPNLSRKLGIELHVKRDDLTGSAWSAMSNSRNASWTSTRYIALPVMFS